MAEPYRIRVLTLYPEMFPGALGQALTGRALANNVWNLDVQDIRDHGIGRHHMVDDTTYGGGAGMVMRADVVGAAIEKAKAALPGARLIYFSPRGQALNQPLVRELSQAPMILLCGRFEGVDERIIEHYQPLELSIGDFVMTGGELAAMALADACVRLLPGVVGEPESLAEESFGNHEIYAGLLEYPHYTKPPNWEGRSVPEALLSGNHAQIRAWRQAQAEAITRARRRDLWEAYAASRNLNGETK